MARGQKACALQSTPMTSEVLTKLYKIRQDVVRADLFVRLILNSASKFMGVGVAME